MYEIAPTAQTDYERMHNLAKRENGASDPFRYTDILSMHNNNERSRNRIRLALQDAVTPFIATVLTRGSFSRALEVGAGTGYFRKHLAPEWLKHLLISFDISNYALPAFQKGQPSAKLFQGDVYNLGVRPESFDAVIGLSSFDSLTDLDAAVEETTKALRPGGFMILLQDLKPELHRTPGTYLSPKTTEDYHRKLTEAVENQKRLTLVEGKTEYLEGLAVRPYVTAFDYEEPTMGQSERKPIAHLNNLGFNIPIVRTDDELLQNDSNTLTHFSDGLNMQKRLDSIPLRTDQVIEWTRLRYVVAQKS